MHKIEGKTVNINKPLGLESKINKIYPSRLPTVLCSILLYGWVSASVFAQKIEQVVPAQSAEPTVKQHAATRPFLTDAQVVAFRLATANNSSGHALAAQHAALLEARASYEKKKWEDMIGFKTKVAGHPLDMYLEYWYLSQMITNRVPLDTFRSRIDAFLKEQKGTYLFERLSGELALALAKKRVFTEMKVITEPLPNWTSGGYGCLRLSKDFQSKTVANELLEIFDPVEACYIVYDELSKQKKITFDNSFSLIRNAVEQNEIKQADRLLQSVYPSVAGKTFRSIMDDPRKWLEAQKQIPEKGAERKLFVLALGRLAREKDLGAAVAYFEKKWLGALTLDEKAIVYSQFGKVASLRLDGRSAQWYKVAGEKVELSNDSHEWRIRMALRQANIDWKAIQQYISAMPPALREKDAWVFWLAKSYEAQGKKEEAKRLFESLDQQFTYYGQLAQEALGKKIQIPKKADLPTEQEMKAALNNPSLIRAIWLFELGWRIEGIREWNFAIREMDDRQLLAAAHLAHNHQILDRAVNTADRTVAEHNFNLRFVSPFKDKMAEKVKATKLETSWVYGLIRQESRFIMDARSGVGASGLMQLMPATAKWVAKKINMKDFTPAKVNDMDVNLTLGTQYLNMVSEKLDYSPALASAAYNAGPSRPIRWRSSLPKEVDTEIFVESIPFDETRDYVQKVLSNATYYEALFTGKPQSLKSRLGTVKPQPITNADLP